MSIFLNRLLEAYLGHYQTSIMESLAKLVNIFEWLSTLKNLHDRSKSWKSQKY